MKKFLLLCFAAVFCCTTNVWALSGSGTESDPFVVQDGDVFTITAQTNAFISFTAPEAGELVLTQSAWGMFGWMVKMPGASDFGQYPGMAEDWEGQKATRFPGMTGGSTYVIKNNGKGWADETITVSFASSADDPNAFSVISAEPPVGSEIDYIVTGESKISFTIDNPVVYMRARIDGSIDGYMTEVEATPVGKGEPVLDENGDPVIFHDESGRVDDFELRKYTQWEIYPEGIKGMDTWTFYEGQEYTVTLVSYEDMNAWNAMTPLFQTSISYVGAAEAVKYSDIILESVTPSPDATNVDEMPSSENPVADFTFSGLVDVTEVAAAGGQGMGLVPLSCETEDVDGKTIVHVTLEGGANDAYITTYVGVKERGTGYGLNDEDGEFAGYFSVANSAYTIDMPWADGRTIDYLLTYSDADPAEGANLTELDTVTFMLGGGGDPDGVYYVNYNATAGVYNEAGEKVRDLLLQKDAEVMEKVIATVCEAGSVNHEDNSGTPSVLTEPGLYTIRIDSMALGDGSFDPNYPWMVSMQGGNIKGRCNPTWTWTVNVVEEIVDVVSVDPAPYNVSGEFCSEIPAQIEVTMSSADFTVSAANVRYGMNIVENVESKIDGATLTLMLAETARAESRIVITVAATASNGGAPIIYGAEDGMQNITLVYQTERNKFVPTAITPTPGEENIIGELSDIIIDFDGTISKINDENVPTVTDADNNDYECSIDFDAELFNRCHVKLSSAIIAKGTYTLTIPEGTLFNDTYDFGFTSEAGEPEGDLYNPELVYVFYVDRDSVVAIAADADGNVKVYTVDGVFVGEGAAADMLGRLPEGIYIINGTKVAVTK